MTGYFLPFFEGFLLQASLIFAVGPQNAMLIRQGLRRERPFLVASIFTLCDALFIVLGVFGLGRSVAHVAWLRVLATYGGSAFLFWFAGKAFLAAWRGGQDLSQTKISRHGALIAIAFAVSLLNPAVIIDTVIIIGSVSSKYQLLEAMAFGFGAIVFSAAFFFLIAGFTRSFAPALNNPAVWRVIDILVGLITAWIGLRLLFLGF